MPELHNGTRRYTIPARPEALIQIEQQIKREDPDLDAIISTLKRDVSLYSTVLATVNAPFFGLRKKVTSIHHAIMLLGFERLSSIVRITALKQSLSKHSRLDRFWDTATEVAGISAYLAGKLTNELPEQAYTVGMMHDCGIPVMMSSFDDYRDMLRNLNGSDVISVQHFESERYGTDHFEIGGEIADTWHMPETVGKTIRLQPFYQDVLKDPQKQCEGAQMLLCVLLLAKDISTSYRRYWRVEEPVENLSGLQCVFDFIGICDLDYMDIKDDYLSWMDDHS